MKTTTTAKQLKKAKEIFLSKPPTSRPYRWIEKHTADSYKTWKQTWDILPRFVVDNRYFCAVDCGYGHDIVIDLKKKETYSASNGIFEPDWCFISDYYGYPEGAFFYKA